MNNTLEVILLGIIEGVTEFLPVSSTGHLLIAQHWLGERSDLFNIAIQSGAMLAVVLIYWQRLWGLFRDPLQPDNRDYLLKLGVAFGVTVVCGAVAGLLGFRLPEDVAPVAWALIAGALFILWVEWLVRHRPSREQVSWTIAIGVGLAQVVAGIFPGLSRSSTTIFIAMLLGMTSRPAATEFAFLVGIPTMFAASVYAYFDLMQSTEFSGEPWSDLVLGFAVSAVVAFLVVKWLLRYIQSHDFVPFAWYRLAVGAALLTWVVY
ncbi:MAG: undecaprenyl-diphosphate phosphatase [Nevskiales bacterium]